MDKLIRKLPLQAKLMLIALIPFCFIVYLTFQVYSDKTEKLNLLNNYREFVKSSSDISGLIDALQDERKYSFDFVMTKSAYRDLLLQRPKTDIYLQKILDSQDPSLIGFKNFTRLSELDNMRAKVDSSTSSSNDVMHFYSNTVFRLNTLNTIPPANTPYLESVYNDLMCQKILSEMITYLGIIRSNIYMILVTQQYEAEILLGTLGAHDVYKSYENELLAKAAPTTLKQYQQQRKSTALKPTVDYINAAFKTFSLGDQHTSEVWWNISDDGEIQLRSLQSQINNRINANIENIYKEHYDARNRYLLLLAFGLVVIFSFVLYIMYLLSSSLRELRIAAESIANGESTRPIRIGTHDAIGKLAKSMFKLSINNDRLASAAAEIGKGNFNVKIQPRSASDKLGNALLQMKTDLELYNNKLEELVSDRTEELARSNEDLQQFAHVASHDLKEPLRKIAMFSNILSSEMQDELSEKGKIYVHKIENAAGRMSKMIEGVLAYSTVAVNEPKYEMVDLNHIIDGVENDLELVIIQSDAKIEYQNLPRVSGISLQMHQVFYNLINNALKFSKKDVAPVIRITSAIETTVSGKREFHIQVRDNGIGFDKEYTDRMFGVFFRLHAKDAYEGTGLGLALCRKIITRHGGRITAEGTVNEGSTFHIYLPYRE